jgi:hypothetical protein
MFSCVLARFVCNFFTLHLQQSFSTLHLRQSFPPLFISNKGFLILTLISSTGFPLPIPLPPLLRLLVLASLCLIRLRPAFLSTAMDTVQEPDLKQASRAKDTAEDIKEKGLAELLEWIQQKRPNPLDDDDVVKAFKKARISGRVFLRHAGDVGFFKNECGLPIGVSEDLAYLVMEIEGVDTAGIKSKLLSFVPCTPRRQQANSVAGKRQQSEDVELSYSQSCKSLAPSIS